MMRYTPEEMERIEKNIKELYKAFEPVLEALNELFDWLYKQLEEILLDE